MLRSFHIFLWAMLLSFCAGAQQWEALDGPEGGNVQNVVQNPANSNELFAKLRGGAVYRSLDLGQQWSYWSLDWGLDYGPWRLMFDPFQAHRIIARNYTGYHYSDDAGLTWIPLLHNLPEGGEIWAFDPTSSTRLLATVNDQVWVSDDFAQTWSVIQTGLNDPSLGLSLQISPLDPNLWIISAGVNAHYITRNGGQLFEPYTGPTIQFGELFVFSLSEPSRLYAQGRHVDEAYMSGDRGLTWQAMPVFSEQEVEYFLETDGQIYFERDDSLYRSSDFGQTAAAYSQLDYADSLTGFFPLQQAGSQWISYGQGGVFVANQAQGPWKRQVDGLGYEFFSRFYNNPFSPSVLGTTATGIWFAPTLNEPWARLGNQKNTGRVRFAAFNDNARLISTIENVQRHVQGEDWEVLLPFSAQLAVMPGNSNTYFAANTEGIHYTLDGGANWTTYAVALGYPLDLAVQPELKRLLILVYGSPFSGLRIFDWQQGTLESVPFIYITRGNIETSSHYPGRVYSSVFGPGYSDDLGATWVEIIPEYAEFLSQWSSKLDTSSALPNVLYTEFSDFWPVVPFYQGSAISYDHGQHWRRVIGQHRPGALVGEDILTQEPFGGLKIWRNVAGSNLAIPALSSWGLGVLFVLFLVIGIRGMQRKWNALPKKHQTR